MPFRVELDIRGIGGLAGWIAARRTVVDCWRNWSLTPISLFGPHRFVHVSLLGLESASDVVVWNTAKAQNFVIVARDSDFEELESRLHGIRTSV